MNWKARLGDITAKYTINKLKKLDTRILIQYFFDEKNQLYMDIEMERRNVDEVTAT